MNVRLHIKFGARDHLEQMQKEGLFYCNTISYFSKSEDAHRGDSFESVINLECLKDGALKLKPANDPLAEWKTLNSTNVQIKQYYDEPLGNLFCMSAFKIN